MNKIKTGILAVMVATFATTYARAANIQYIDANGNMQTADATAITSATTLTDGWYYVSGTMAGGSITINATGTGVHLILTDGCSFTVNGGILVASSNKLTIYGQTSGTGSLKALAAGTAAANSAGIGGNPTYKNGGIITINGGTVTAAGNGNGAGIGGGGNGGNSGFITINGGTVTATNGSVYSAGIGGALNGGSYNNDDGNTITINGGTVTATGGNYAAAIGGGDGGNSVKTAINGGTVTAIGGTVGIGAGRDGTDIASFTMNGNAVVFAAKGVSHAAPKTQGILFSSNNYGVVYGNVTLEKDLTIAAGQTLYIPSENQTLTINSGVTLTNNGTIDKYGTIDNNGTITGSGAIIGRRTQAALTVSSVGTKTYGDGDFYLSVSGGSGTGAVTYTQVSGPGTVTPGGQVTITGAGNIVVTATKAGDADYAQTTSAQETIEIEKATLTGISFPVAAGAITYGAALSTVTFSGGSGSGTFAFNAPATVPTVAQSGSSFAATFTPADANYNTVSGNIAVTVNPANLSGATVTISGDYTYNGMAQTPPAGNVTVSLTPFGNLAGNGTNYSLSASDNTGAGTATLTVTGTGNFTGTETQSFTIAPKALTVSGIAFAVKTYDATTGATMNGALSLAGVVGANNVTLDVSGVSYAFANAAAGTTTVNRTGDYALTGADNANYSLTQPAVSFTATAIAKKDITITGLAASNKVYDGTATATATGTPALSDNYDGANLTVDAGSAAATFDSKNVGTGKTVTFSGYALGGLAAGNYTLSAQPANATADITAKAVTITGLAALNKEYDGTATATVTGTPALSDNYDGADLTVNAGSAAATFDSKNVGTGKTVTFSGYALDGLEAGNYTLSAQPASVTADITPATLTVTPDALTVTPDAAQSKVYGTTDPTLTYTAAVWQGSDGASLLSGTLDRAAGENAGAYAIGLGTLAETSGNYTVSFTTGVDFTITHATVTLSLLTHTLTVDTAYDALPKPVDVTAAVAGLGAITVRYTGTNGTVYATSVIAPADSGYYLITADIAPGANFAAVTGLSIGTLHIRNKAVTVTDGVILAGDHANVPVGGQFILAFPGKMDTNPATQGTVTLAGTWDRTSQTLAGYWKNDSVFVVDYRYQEYLADYTLTVAGFHDLRYQHVYVQTFTLTTQDYPPAPVIVRYVTLPQVDGCVMTPVAGMYTIRSGSDFTFTFTLPAGKIPAVNTNRLISGVPETLTGTPDGDGSYTFVIRAVYQNVEVSITTTAGNEEVTAGAPQVRAYGGNLYVHTETLHATPVQLRIYTLNGTLYKQQEITGGDTVIPLPAGIFIVLLDGRRYKIANVSL
jgi:hypothetical protein